MQCLRSGRSEDFVVDGFALFEDFSASLCQESEFTSALYDDGKMDLVASYESTSVGHRKDGGAWLSWQSRRYQFQRILEGQSRQNLDIAEFTENDMSFPVSGGHIVHVSETKHSKIVITDSGLTLRFKEF